MTRPQPKECEPYLVVLTALSMDVVLVVPGEGLDDRVLEPVCDELAHECDLMLVRRMFGS